jgi:DNA polymerase-3 subunit epsilon/exodeoxyribonuclease X
VLVYINLKSTGFEANDRVCGMGLLLCQEEIQYHSELIKAPKKLRPEASAIHHITDEMLKEKHAFKESFSVQLLEKYNNSDNIFIGHDMKFIATMLEKEGFVIHAGVIDTLKCARAMIEECEQFSLQYLRYELKLYRDETTLAKKLDIDTSNTLSDVLHVRLLHTYLNDLASDEKLLNISVNPVLLQKLNFGKYKGSYIEEIVMNDRAYIMWLINNLDTIDEDLLYSIQHYLKLL